MTTSENGLNLIKSFEGLRLTAYRCPGGKWTIGYGHTIKVKIGMCISEELATHFLIEDVQRVEPVINSYDDIYHWTQNEFDALVSFAFNCGTRNLRRLFKYGIRNKSQIANAFLLYTKSNGKVLRGLIRRRNAERKLFLKG